MDANKWPVGEERLLTVQIIVSLLKAYLNQENESGF